MEKTYHSRPVVVIIAAAGLVVAAIRDYHNSGGFGRAIAFIIILLLLMFMLQKNTYLIIKNGDLQYRHFGLKRPPVRIADIAEIKGGPAFGGMGKALYVVYIYANRERSLKIYSKNFSDEIINEVVREILHINPTIQVDR